MASNPTPGESSRVDANQQFSLVGVQGTLGTSDAGGTAKTVALAGDPVTGALYVNNIGAAGGGGGSNVNVFTGTQQTLGTVGTVPGIGTVTNVGSITNIGNVAFGTVLNTGTGVNVVTGTLQNSGSSTGVGVVSALTNGSVNILTGTLQNSGSSTGVGVVSALTNGSVNVLTGTVTSVTNLAGGTTQVNMVPVVIPVSSATLGTTGAAVWGTLVASSGNGIKQYIQAVSVVVASGTVDVAIANGIGGSTGVGVYVRGQFPQGGGIEREFNPIQATGTGGTITYWLGGAGTVAMVVNYWQAA